MDPSRQKLDLQGLLKYAVQNTNTENDSKGAVTKLDEEDQKFIQNAMASMSVDLTKDLDQALATLESPSSTTEERKESFETIRSYIDDLDIANYFAKRGGQTLLRYLKDSDEELRELAIYAVAEMSQNNPHCQLYFLREDVIKLLISYISDTNENVSRTAIHALGSLIRNCQPGIKEFLRQDGIKALMPCLSSSVLKVYIKSVFLIGTLASQSDSMRAVFVQANAASLLVNNLESVDGYDLKQETTLLALSSLLPAKKWDISEIESNTMVSLLKRIVADKKSLENCQDIVNYAQQILKDINA